MNYFVLKRDYGRGDNCILDMIVVQKCEAVNDAGFNEHVKEILDSGKQSIIDINMKNADIIEMPYKEYFEKKSKLFTSVNPESEEVMLLYDSEFVKEIHDAKIKNLEWSQGADINHRQLLIQDNKKYKFSFISDDTLVDLMKLMPGQELNENSANLVKF